MAIANRFESVALEDIVNEKKVYAPKVYKTKKPSPGIYDAKLVGYRMIKIDSYNSNFVSVDLELEFPDGTKLSKERVSVPIEGNGQYSFNNRTTGELIIKKEVTTRLVDFLKSGKFLEDGDTFGQAMENLSKSMPALMQDTKKLKTLLSTQNLEYQTHKALSEEMRKNGETPTEFETELITLENPVVLSGVKVGFSDWHVSRKEDQTWGVFRYGKPTTSASYSNIFVDGDKTVVEAMNEIRNDIVKLNDPNLVTVNKKGEKYPKIEFSSVTVLGFNVVAKR